MQKSFAQFQSFLISISLHSQNVSSDFKLEIEAYYSVMQNPDNPAWTPMRTPKKSTYSSVPKYCLAAHAQLTNDNIQDGFSVSDFVMGKFVK